MRKMRTLETNMSALVITKIIAVFLSIIRGISSNPCDFDVRLRHSLCKNSGFHRNMSYSITFSSTNEQLLYKDCIVGLEQIFPPGVFTNSDELLEYRHSHKLRAIPKNKINVELPAEHSQPSTVYMVGKMSSSDLELWLPVHARYHRAVAGGGKATNVIGPPNLYLRCPEQRLAVCDNQMNTSLSFLCNGSRDKCTWRELPFTLITDELTWEVPVGNTDHYYLVATATTAAVVAGSLYLLKVIHQFQVGKKTKND